jgi:D-3-phosphoglycerate dehydrogenase
VPRIIRLTAPIFPQEDFERTAFAAAGLQPVIVDSADPDEIAAHVADADVVALIGTKLPTPVVDTMARCRLIARMGTGTDRIDVARATERGIVVANTPYFCVADQADHTMALLLALNRRLSHAQRSMAAGRFAEARRAAAAIQRLETCTLGLVGFGRSAVQTARRARAFGMRVLATRRNRSAPDHDAVALDVEMTDFDTVLRESDYVSLHVPLNAATRHMIDAAAFEKMKPTACLINTSRGANVDEAALVDALRRGRIAGAGIDTYELLDPFVDEAPPHLHPLSGMDNVILTPHLAGHSIQAKQDMMTTAVENIVRVLAGRWPDPAHIVNPQVTPRFPLVR